MENQNNDIGSFYRYDQTKRISFHTLLTIIAGVVYFKWKESRKDYERYKKMES